MYQIQTKEDFFVLPESNSVATQEPGLLYARGPWKGSSPNVDNLQDALQTYCIYMKKL
jgi:hypothetical protein